MIRRFDAGEFGPGARLPAEDRLADEYGVSRPTVRKVLLRLRTEGYIVSRRGAGSYAIRIAEEVARPSFSDEAITNCMVFRQAIEPSCAALMAERWEEPELDRLLACQAELEIAARNNDAMAFESADFEFHQLIALFSRNAYFAEAITQNAEMIRCTQRPAADLPSGQKRLRFGETLSEHAEIIAAIRKRSSMEASDAMKQHLSNARRQLRQGGGAAA